MNAIRIGLASTLKKALFVRTIHKQGLLNASRCRVQQPQPMSTAPGAFIDVKYKNDVLSVNHKWLRENCQCPSCYNHASDKKQVSLHEIKPAQENIASWEYNDDAVNISWADGHNSTFDIQWLNDNIYPGRTPSTKPVLWDVKSLAATGKEPVPFEGVMKDDAKLRELLNNIALYGFGMINGAPPTVEGTRVAASRVCLLMNTLYGELGHIENNGRADYADLGYTNGPLLPHTDMVYFPDPPGIQGFHCLGHDGTGGMTVVVDAFHAAEQLREKDPKAFDLLCRYDITYEWKYKNLQDMRNAAPMLKINPYTKDMEYVRFNIYDGAPISTVPQKEIPAYHAAFLALYDIINDPANVHQIKLKPGIVLFVDNWRMVHGRTAFTGPREMVSFNMTRHDLLSRMRVMGIDI